MRIKKYEQFIDKNIDRRFKFEEKIIDPILSIIRNNQEYLTLPENLPQLAKLGWIYNTLWYAGRFCWGSRGALIDPTLTKDNPDSEDYIYTYTSCDDNPKYKIEECEPENEDIENLIYDAWGMHVSNELSTPSYEEFVNKIKNGRKLSNLDRKLLKTNKTIDEWVEVLTDKDYKYSSLYPNRRRVLDHLLCTIGNGYGLSKDGFVYSEASGADQDEANYGDWENCKFRSDINTEINRLLQFKELKATLNTTNKYESDNKKKDNSLLSFGGAEETIKLFNKFKLKFNKEQEQKYSTYYPISSSSIIFKIADKEAQKREGIKSIESSYIKAAIEVCKDILSHKKEEKDNIKMAEDILGKLGVEGFTFKGPAFDKYELLKEIKDIFSDFTDEFDGVETSTPTTNFNSWYIHLDDTAVSSYGSNNYCLKVNLSKNNSFPKGSSRSIEFLKSTTFYKGLKNSLERLKKIDDIKLISFGYDNIPDDNSVHAFKVEMIVNNEYVGYEKEQEKSDLQFIKQGFQVGTSYIILKVDNMNIVARKPKTLGSKHPMNVSGKEYFSNALQMHIYNNDFSKELEKFSIDERKFNSIYSMSSINEKIKEWVLTEHEEMKKSDNGYGFGEKEGTKCLYVHDFMLWLKEHINNLK